MQFTDKQKKRVAEIIERHVGWMVGWSVSHDERDKCYREAAEDVASYLTRSFRHSPSENT